MAFNKAMRELCPLVTLLIYALLNSVAADDAKLPQNTDDQHLGVVTCAGSTCHGATEPSRASSVKQDEFIIWNRKDKHAKAYTVLFNDASKRIAKNLDLPFAHTAKICLDCHADNVPATARGKRFQLDDGIGCEACHGGGEHYLGVHVSGNSTHKNNVSLGMYPTEDPEARAKLCLSCHLGNKDKLATHRIMGAGHPRISFELDTFTQIQPAHYVLDKDYKERKGVWTGVQVWAVGQLLAVEQTLSLLLEPGYQSTGMLPELAFFDCHACHRPMKKPHWAPRESSGLGPGVIHLNDANLLMLRSLLGILAPELAARLREAILHLHQATTVSMVEARKVAEQMRPLVAEIRKAVLDHEFSAQDMRAMIAAIVSDGIQGNYNDYGTAEQAAMALGSLAETLRLGGGLSVTQAGQLDSSLKEIDAVLKNENAYDSERLVLSMKSIAATLTQ